MAEISLGKHRTVSSGWKTWLVVALVAGILGLGVKTIWFDTKGYLVPDGVIPVGANLANEHFKVVRLSLGRISGSYLTSDKHPVGFAMSTMESGQLIAKSKLSPYPPESISRLVVTNKTQLGSAIRSGAEVSVWSAQRLAGNQFDAPKRLVARAVVSKVIKNSAVFGGQNQQVEILVKPIQAPAILAAMASDSPLFLVAQQ